MADHREDFEVPSIGNLIDALDAEAVSRSQAAQHGLTERLPGMAEAQAAALSDGQRGALTEALRFSAGHAWPTYHDVPFVLAILAAAPAFGDESTLESVEQLAASSDQPEVRAAAASVLPALRSRVEVLPARRSLLRASDDTAEAERTMVRPVPAADVLPRPTDS